MALKGIYQQFLTRVGLEHFHFVLLILIMASFLILLYYASRFGVFHEVQFREQTLPSSAALYFNHKGSYNKIGEAFHHALQSFNEEFKISRMFGLYYDNPKQIEHQQQCRSTIGLMVNAGQLFKVDQFLLRHPKFKRAEMPATRCISTYHPYVNELSFMIIVGKVYPKLSAYIKKNQLRTGEGVMEIYNFLSSSNKTVQTAAVLQNFQYFMLWPRQGQQQQMDLSKQQQMISKNNRRRE